MHAWEIVLIFLVLSGIRVWVLHRRASKAMAAPLQRLALEFDGDFTPRMFFLPKLTFRHQNRSVEISAASTSIRGQRNADTYALFSGLEVTDFKFRLQPDSFRADMDFGDLNAGPQTMVKTGNSAFDKRFILTGNDAESVRSIFSPEILEKILLWDQQSPQHPVSDIRPYDDKLVCRVKGILSSYSDYRRFIDIAIACCDQVVAEQGKQERGGRGEGLIVNR